MSECIYAAWKISTCRQAVSNVELWCSDCQQASEALPPKYLSKIERDILSAPLWNAPRTAIEAEERRQRRDDHVQALQHALTSQKTDAAVCPGCFETVQFTKNDCLEHHPPGSVPCSWSGHQRAAVEHAIAMRAAENKAYQNAGVPLHDYCACGRTMPLTAKYCKKCEPKPPTLREWLGPRVAELGPWAEVLREQPVPAGWIVRWEWMQDAHGWRLRGHTTLGYATSYRAESAAWSIDDGPIVNHLHAVQRDSLQTALFTRHPAVKPEPRLTIGCEDQYEV